MKWKDFGNKWVLFSTPRMDLYFCQFFALLALTLNQMYFVFVKLEENKEIKHEFCLRLKKLSTIYKFQEENYGLNINWYGVVLENRQKTSNIKRIMMWIWKYINTKKNWWIYKTIDNYQNWQFQKINDFFL